MTTARTTRLVLIACLILVYKGVVFAFSPKLNAPRSALDVRSRQGHGLARRRMGGEEERSMVDEMNFFKADIPDEIRKEIFDAEAQTQAGQERAGRLANYAAIVFLGLGVAIFNAFLTGVQEDGTSLSDAGFGWVEDNFLNNFLFTSKIGGGIALISAGVSAVLSEIEIRGRRDNVEKIWREVQRRKEEREKGGGRREGKKKGAKNKKKAQKQAKRLSALSEVIVEQPEQKAEDADTTAAVDVAPTAGKEVANKSGNEKPTEEGGIFGKIKGFYEKADNMAASQALLLNKELEDRGIVDKITDQTGLKVIGKEAASKLEEKDTSKGGAGNQKE